MIFFAKKISDYSTYTPKYAPFFDKVPKRCAKKRWLKRLVDFGLIKICLNKFLVDFAWWILQIWQGARLG
ncbi:hypothetical protein CQA40_08705 [Helicobacter sp. MIT 01-3238]|nr:hypothetical protein CQA40_08705 [Helicobacter sp. MIT 01-3238]